MCVFFVFLVCIDVFISVRQFIELLSVQYMIIARHENDPGPIMTHSPIFDCLVLLWQVSSRCFLSFFVKRSFCAEFLARFVSHEQRCNSLALRLPYYILNQEKKPEKNEVCTSDNVSQLLVLFSCLLFCQSHGITLNIMLQK